ncbi:hypothetical protein RJ639_038410 [Escallonia herrerae]|uniref:Uncharacterized protein n=1 Tax=Escallonia herrerae TaxID=1293975 RepID=A0AA89B9R3_9ASTE|nr:hypothetical protein RJ639_038410 [Escallonia herrerae]
MAEESEASSTSEQSSPRNLPEEAIPKQPQAAPFCGFAAAPNGNFQMFPIMYPALVPGLFPLQQGQEQMNGGAGIYAVPVLPFMGPVAGYPSNTLIPLTYNVPTGPSSSETAAVGDGQGQMGQQQQPAAPQRQVVVRRFQIQFQLDLLLMLKLAAVIFLFNQDGSRQRLVLLMYQTGALAPLIRWLSQGMQRAAAPPQPPRPAVRADAAGARQGNENAAAAEGQPGAAENENLRPNDRNQPGENDNVADAAPGNGRNRLWVIVKEVQMIVFGFITSLLPGFHNIDA